MFGFGEIYINRKPDNFFDEGCSIKSDVIGFSIKSVSDDMAY